MTKEMTCPKCGKEVWDTANVDQALNKCWDCGLKWLSEPDDDKEYEEAQKKGVFYAPDKET